MRSSLNLQGACRADQLILVEFASASAPSARPVPIRKDVPISSPQPSHRHLRKGAWISAALLVLVLFFLARRWAGAGFDTTVFLRSCSQADPRWLAAAWLLGLATYYGRVLRWLVMLRPLAPHASQASVLRATLIGFTAVYLFGRPGEVVRPYLIARSAGVPFLSQMAAWLLERIYDTLLVLALFGYSLTVVLDARPAAGPTIAWLLDRGGWIIGITGSICLAALIALQLFSDHLERRILDALGFLQQHHQQRAASLVRAGVDTLRATSGLRPTLLLVFYSILEWFIIYLCYLAIFRAFPASAHLETTAILTYIGFVAFGSIVQIPGIGGGFQIVSVLVLTELFHIPLEPAAGIALISWAVTLAGVVPAGIAAALHEGLSWRRIVQIEKEVAS